MLHYHDAHLGQISLRNSTLRPGSCHSLLRHHDLGMIYRFALPWVDMTYDCVQPISDPMQKAPCRKQPFMNQKMLPYFVGFVASGALPATKQVRTLTGMAPGEDQGQAHIEEGWPVESGRLKRIWHSPKHTWPQADSPNTVADCTLIDIHSSTIALLWLFHNDRVPNY